MTASEGFLRAADLEVKRLHGMPNAIVGHAWFHTDNAEEILAQHASFPLVRGIRSKRVDQDAFFWGNA
jgi:hypothetical protein